MRTFKFKPTNLLLVILLIISMTSCNEDISFYPFIETVPCETPVAADPAIINDFQCQDNMLLPDIEVIRNLSETGINKSTFIGKYVDPTGRWDALIIDYGASIDLSDNNIFKIKVQTSVAGTLKVKLEGGTSREIDVDATISNTTNWVEYSFDFSDQFNQNHQKLVLFFNADVETSGTDVYYIDDLRWEASTDPCIGTEVDLNIINDFDCQTNQDVPEVELTATRSKNAINDSKFSGKYIDEIGAWDAVIIDFGAPIDLSTNNAFKIKVLAPVEGTLKAKLQDGTSAEIEKDVQITTTGQWVEYTFDFSSEANANHQKLVLFFNAGVDTDGTDVYYIDDLKFAEVTDPCNGVVTDLSIINDFNCQQNSEVTCCIPNEIVENPNPSGINTSDAVLKVTDNGTEQWDALVFDFGGPIDLTTNNILKIKVLSTRAVPLLAKLEGGTSVAEQVLGAITVVGEWAEYTFDFSGQATENHNKVVFFFNVEQTDGTANDVYYIDDIQFKEVVIVPPAIFNMPFDANYTDLISSTNATVVGTPGFAGQSVQGTDAYAGAADSYLTFPTAGLTTTEFSATMWYKLDNNPDKAGILVMGPEDTGNASYPTIQNLRTNGFRFFRDIGSNGNQIFKLNVGDGGADTWVDGGIAANVDPTNDSWIHLAFTISSTQATVYINGILVAQSDFSGIDWTGCNLLSIMSGDPRFTEWSHFSDNSYLDDLKFFNVALSQPQIEAIMVE